MAKGAGSKIPSWKSFSHCLEIDRGNVSTTVRRLIEACKKAGGKVVTKVLLCTWSKHKYSVACILPKGNSISVKTGFDKGTYVTLGNVSMHGPEGTDKIELALGDYGFMNLEYSDEVDASFRSLNDNVALLYMRNYDYWKGVDEVKIILGKESAIARILKIQEEEEEKELFG